MDPVRFILICLAGWLNNNQQEVIDYLREEVRVLREQAWTQTIAIYGRAAEPVGEKSQEDQIWKAQGNGDDRYSADLVGLASAIDSEEI